MQSYLVFDMGINTDILHNTIYALNENISEYGTVSSTYPEVIVNADNTAVDVFCKFAFTPKDSEDKFEFGTIRIRNSGKVALNAILSDIDKNFYICYTKFIMDFALKYFPKYKETGNLEDLDMRLKE